MSTITSYLFLVLAVVLGTAANSFAKSAEGFTYGYLVSLLQLPLSCVCIPYPML